MELKAVNLNAVAHFKTSEGDTMLVPVTGTVVSLAESSRFDTGSLIYRPCSVLNVALSRCESRHQD